MRDFILFTSGAVIGGAIMYGFLSKRFDERLDAEVEALRGNTRNSDTETEKVPDKSDFKGVIEYANNIIKEERYRAYNSSDLSDDNNETAISVISAEEFDTLDDYSVNTLFYYADGYLCDDDECIYDNAEMCVGTNWKNEFGKNPNDPDSVYVRNTAMRADFEILKDLRNFKDVIKDKNYIYEDMLEE